MPLHRRRHGEFHPVQDHLRSYLVSLLCEAGHETTHGRGSGRPFPDRHREGLNPAKKIPRLLRNPSRNITEMGCQHIGDSCQLADDPCNGPGRNGEVGMNHIGLPSAHFSNGSGDRPGNPEHHLRHTAGILTLTKGPQSTNLHSMLYGFYGKVGHPTGQHADLMTSGNKTSTYLGSQSTPAPPDRWMLVVENQDFHRPALLLRHSPRTCWHQRKRRSFPRPV